jgi:putative restriction endonuclease
MSNHDFNYWLKKFSRLRVDRASRHPAPHKPLLLLAIIDQIEDETITSPEIKLTPELAFRFRSYWSIVATRLQTVGKVELPFFHLKGDGILLPVAVQGLEAALSAIRPRSVQQLNQIVSHALLAEDLFEFLQQAENRFMARKMLISGDWFSSTEKMAISEMLGLPLATEYDEQDLKEQREIEKSIVGRDARFRLQIVPMYRYSCALCGRRVLLPSGMTLVEAAHIHQFAKSQNNDVSNGMALCKNHHWAFDLGLWSIDEKYRTIVALDSFSEFSNGITLADFHMRPLDFSWLKVELWPGQKNLAWHRENVFLSRIN